MRRPCKSGLRSSIGLGSVPDTADTVAVHVAGLLVLDEGVERFAVIGPHPGAVLALDDSPTAFALGAGAGLQRRPVGGTFVVAVRFALFVLVVGIKGHAVGVGIDFG